MTYSIEKPKNINLEDTAVPNLFITDFMPDVPDGDFVKVYIYAYMCCRQGIAMTHKELAASVGLSLDKVLSAWRYFAERRIVKLFPQTASDGERFDVEFVDVKGMLYAGGARDKAASAADGKNVAGGLNDPALAGLFRKIAGICGEPSVDGSDAQRIISWAEEDGATPELIEFAYLHCMGKYGKKDARYVGKVVKKWAGRGLKTKAEALDYLADTDARNAAYKKLMEALGMRYSVITEAEEKIFDRWIDDFGYTLDRLLELAEKTAGVGNKFKYLGGIIRKEREAEGKDTGGATGPQGSRSGMSDRNEYYRGMRLKNEDAVAARLKEVYGAVPALKQVDDEISTLNLELVKTLTSGMKDKQRAVKSLNKEIADAAERRKALLTGAGYAPDYTDMHYACPRCQDSGVLENGASCDCYSIKAPAKATAKAPDKTPGKGA